MTDGPHPLLRNDLNRARASLADDVVYRDFPSETIVLNLATGQYHGLNPVAGRMLAMLDESPSVGAAVSPLAREFGQAEEVIAQDLDGLCRALLDRGLISVAPVD
jgi:hypothetical protein